MPKRIDLTNLKFGRLTVVKLGNRTSKGKTFWECICDCGTVKQVHMQPLKEGKTLSCGCLKSEVTSKRLNETPILYRLPFGEAAMNTLMNSYKQSCKTKAIKWGLTKDQFKELTKGDCHYCGVKPSQKREPIRDNGYYIYNGIDRVNSMGNYTLENCVSCCETCNKAKLDMTEEKFYTWIERVYKHLKEVKNAI